MTASVPSSTRPGRFHAAVWRWHFLIGMLVMPFLFMLAGSGGLMLLSKPLDNVLNQKLMTVAPGENPLPASVLLETVREAYPHATVKLICHHNNGSGRAFLVTERSWRRSWWAWCTEYRGAPESLHRGIAG